MDVGTRPLIAYIDDDAFVLEAVVGLLKAHSYTVLALPSAEALMADERLSQVSCLVTDLKLGGISGLQLRERLRSMGLQIPTIIVTAFADDRLRQRAREQGVVAVLEKPVIDAKLLLAIATALPDPER